LDTPQPAPEPRDANGRFGPGNAGGPGRPKGKGYELQRAAQDAVSAEHIQALMRKALRMGLEGNLPALKFVIERTCGRAPEMTVPMAPTDLALPSLRTAENCAAALDRILAAINAGTIGQSAARVMIDVVHARLKAIEVKDLGDRLAELEEQTRNVDFGRR
jgi:hypothetical protein